MTFLVSGQDESASGAKDNSPNFSGQRKGAELLVFEVPAPQMMTFFSPMLITINA